MTLPPTRDILVALTARDLAGRTAPFTARDVWRLRQSLRDGGATFQQLLQSHADISGVRPEDVRRARDRLELLDGVDSLIRSYEDRGIWVLTAADLDYPARLRSKLGDLAPVVLFGAGEAKLLTEPGIGVVGSRDLGDDGAAVTQALGAAIAQAGMTLVSGGARGADQIAMNAAAERGGSVVGVLAHPLNRQVADRSARELIEEHRLCLITAFMPSAGFSVANAMARNKLIYALSKQTVVVASDFQTGGTWAGATEALKRGFGSVRVWSASGGGPGNGPLVEMGATPLADVHELVQSTPGPSTSAEQLSFGSG